MNLREDQCPAIWVGADYSKGTRPRPVLAQSGSATGVVRLPLMAHNGHQPSGSRLVRRQINWNNWRPDLREHVAHLIVEVKQRPCGVASAVG